VKLLHSWLIPRGCDFLIVNDSRYGCRARAVVIDSTGLAVPCLFDSLLTIIDSLDLLLLFIQTQLNLSGVMVIITQTTSSHLSLKMTELFYNEKEHGFYHAL
jgi:hypothetical protein